MKNENRHFTSWVMGIAASLIVAGVLALAATISEHQVKIALLWEHCPECREALAAMPRERKPSILAAFRIYNPEPSLEQDGKRERR